MAFKSAFGVASKLPFLLATVIQAPSSVPRMPNMVGYLRENTQWLQVHSLAELDSLDFDLHHF